MQDFGGFLRDLCGTEKYLYLGRRRRVGRCSNCAVRLSRRFDAIACRKQGNDGPLRRWVSSRIQGSILVQYGPLTRTRYVHREDGGGGRRDRKRHCRRPLSQVVDLQGGGRAGRDFVGHHGVDLVRLGVEDGGRHAANQHARTSGLRGYTPLGIQLQPDSLRRSPAPHRK